MSTYDKLSSLGSNLIGVPIDVANTALETTGETASILGKTTTGVVGHVGQAATSATGIASNTVQTFETLSERINNSTEEMAKRRAEIEREKTSKQQGKTAQQIAQIEADTDLQLQEIENKFNADKMKMENEQTLMLERLNTTNNLAALSQTENNDKITECYYYGFKTPAVPYERGTNKTSIYYSTDKVWFYSYVPISFVSQTGTFIEFAFPKRTLGESRTEFIEASNKGTAEPVIVGIELVNSPGYLWNSQIKTPFIKQGDSKEFGKLYFKKVWFFEKKEKMGGGSRGGRRNRSRRDKRKRLRTRKTKKGKKSSRRTKRRFSKQ